MRYDQDAFIKERKRVVGMCVKGVYVFHVVHQVSRGSYYSFTYRYHLYAMPRKSGIINQRHMYVDTKLPPRYALFQLSGPGSPKA